MRLKLGLAALLVSISVLLLQSNSFSTAEIRNDIALSVVEENEALIAITNWEGRKFTVLNNTGTTVNIESITLSIDNWLGVEEELSYLAPGQGKEFTLMGKGLELSGEEIQIIASWEAGRAEIVSEIPELELDETENKCESRQVVGEDTILQDLDEEDLEECSEQPNEIEEAVTNGGFEGIVEDEEPFQKVEDEPSSGEVNEDMVGDETALEPPE